MSFILVDNNGQIKSVDTLKGLQVSWAKDKASWWNRTNKRDQIAVSYVFQALQLISGGVLTLDYVVKDVVTGEEVDTLAVDVIEDIANAVLSYHVFGVGVLKREKRGNRLYLRWLPYPDLTFHQDSDGNITSVEHDGERLLLNDLIIFRNLDTGNKHVTGVSSVDVALRAAEVSDNVVEYVRSFFENGAVPLVLLVSDRPIPRKEIENIETVWKRMLRGAKKAFSTMVLRFGIKPHVITPPIRDLDVSNIDTFVRGQIASAFNIPPQLLGEQASAASYRYALYVFSRTNIQPLARRIEIAINRVLGPRDFLSFQWDFTRTPEYAMDLGVRADAALKLTSSGVLDVKQARRLVGLDLEIYGDVLQPDKAQDKPLLDGFHVEKPRDKLDQELFTPQTKHLGELIAKFVEVSGRVDVVTKAWDRDSDEFLNDLERDALAYLLSVFERHMKYVLNNGRDLDMERMKKKVETSMGTFFDRFVLPVVYYTYMRHVRETNIAPETAVDDVFLAYKNGKKYIGRFVETTLRNLGEALKEAEMGERFEDSLAGLISPLFDTNRAQLVIDNAFTQGIYDATDMFERRLKSKGVTYIKVWRTARDERVCPICAPMEGKPESEWGGLSIPAHHRCRCWPELVRVEKQQ